VRYWLLNTSYHMFIVSVMTTPLLLYKMPSLYGRQQVASVSIDTLTANNSTNDNTTDTQPTTNDETTLLDPVGGNTETDTREITTFKAPSVGAIVPTMTHHESSNFSLVKQGLIDFLERPFRVSTFTWNNLSSRGNLLDYYDPYDALMSRPSVYNKFQNLQYFRANCKLRFQVTGNQFVCGKVRAVWIPNDYSIDSLTAATGILNGVDIYPSDNSTYELNIPYFQQYKYFDLGLNGGPDTFTFCPNFGIVGLYVVSPLVCDDSTATVHITTYASFTDIEIPEIYSPTPLPAYVPRGISLTSISSFSGVNNVYDAFLNLRSYILPPPLPAIPTSATLDTGSSLLRMVPNGGRAEGGTSAELVEKQATSNPIGRVIGSFLSPVLAPVAALASTVSAVATGVGGIASAFNLDKPVVRRAPEPLISRFTELSNGDGISTAQPLTLLSGNGVNAEGQLMVQSPNDMSISYLCSIPQMVGYSTVTTSTTTMGNLFSWGVSPANCITSPPTSFSPYSNSRASVHTYASYCATAFEYWRGDLVFDVEAIAQSFSKCSIGLTWVPGIHKVLDTRPGVIPIIDEEWMSTAYSTIINVSGTTRGQLVIPFINDYFALSNNMDVSGFSTNGDLVRPVVNGTLVVYLINTLTSFSPSGAGANPVDLLFYASWRNLQFFKPTVNRMSMAIDDDEIHDEDTMNYTLPAMLTHPGVGLESRMVANSSDVGEKEAMISKMSSNLLQPTELFGESTDCIIDLCRRPGVGQFFSVKGENDSIVSLDYSYFLNPQGVVYPTCSSGSNCLFPISVGPAGYFGDMGRASFLRWFSQLYMQQRGEINYTVLFPSTVGDNSKSTDNNWVIMSNNSIVRYQYGYDRLSAFVPYLSSLSLGALISNGSYYRANSSSTNPPSVMVPWYSNANWMFPWRCDRDPLEQGEYQIADAPGVTITLPYYASNGQMRVAVLEEASDRFSFAYPFPPPTTRTIVSWRAPSGNCLVYN